MSLIATIGLEVHVQLKTRSKMFCGCANDFGHPPNTNVCPVCLGYPGALPVPNAEAIRLTVLTGMLIRSRINQRSKFDRKNYFYPDMPKNYQISQYDQPLCIGGGVDFELEGKPQHVGITRIHLEEDVAKNSHFPGASGIDFNRAGTPLMEIVTEPDIVSADQALAFLLALKQILLYGGVSECNLEQGNLRCDVNVSVRQPDAKELGTKVEIKNMNTFKGVHRALVYEIQRQIREVGRGGALVQETRRWDDEAGRTESMRTKEDAHDYRYFPDPDLLPVILSDAQLRDWSSALPELPEARRARLVTEYGLPEYDAGVLVADKAVADFFEATAKLSGNAKAASNWTMTEVLRCLKEQDIELGAAKITAQGLADLIKLVDAKTINMPSAREVFGILFAQGGQPQSIVAERGMAQVSDTSALEAFVDKAIAENEKSVAAFRSGKEAALQFLVGQVMKMSRGKANPPVVIELLKRKLS